MQIDFSVCTSISHLLPSILLRHPLCQAGHLCMVPTTCGSVSAAGSCRGGSHPALWYPSCLTSLSHLLILHMFAGEGEPACKDRYLEEEQTYPSAKPHDLCGHCLTQLLLTVRKEKLQSSFRLQPFEHFPLKGVCPVCAFSLVLCCSHAMPSRADVQLHHELAWGTDLAENSPS